MAAGQKYQRYLVNSLQISTIWVKTGKNKNWEKIRSKISFPKNLPIKMVECKGIEKNNQAQKSPYFRTNLLELRAFMN
jgi:hypothetical protein